jgi:predicted MFS family arabinose efflux permease
MISTRTSPREQGLANGGAQSTASLGLILGPIWGGLVYEQVGLTSPFWTSTVLLLLAAALVFVDARFRPLARPAHAEQLAGSTGV